MIKHLRNLLKPGRTKMRLASILAFIAAFSACATSVRQSEIEQHPTMAVPFAAAAPVASQRPQTFADCLDESLAAAPSLVPDLAEKCCGMQQLGLAENHWCERRRNYPPVSATDGDDGYIRWVHESSYCQLLQSLRQDIVYQVSLGEIEIQCRLSQTMGRDYAK